ncbi:MULTISPECIES: dihydrofolate reductase family protein [unclassified Micromonospora]|uniref:dihydrofolate reductase family protein n=1 Tax=unclassified Micromonospora TaxID=2617518 RepID=UPI0036348B05
MPDPLGRHREDECSVDQFGVARCFGELVKIVGVLPLGARRPHPLGHRGHAVTVVFGNRGSRLLRAAILLWHGDGIWWREERRTMARLLYSATASLDGFIAGPGGDMSWLTEHLTGENPTAERLLANVGAILAGNGTFGGSDPNRGTDKEGAFGGQYHGPVFVLTHRPPAEPHPGITFGEGGPAVRVDAADPRRDGPLVPRRMLNVAAA